MKNILQKIVLGLVVAGLFPVSGFSQAAQRFYTALQPNPSGGNFAQIIPYASVYVCQYNAQLACNSQLTIYSDVNLTKSITQPVLANKNGVYQYYVQNPTQVVEKVCATYNQCVYNAVYVGAGSSGGSGTCGSVSGDNTSTNCGYNNRVGDTAVIPADVTSVGYQNLANNSGTQVVAIGSTAGTGNKGTDLVAIGNNAGGIANVGANDLVAIGDNAAQGATADEVVAIGNNAVQGSSISNFVAIGDGSGQTVTTGGTSDGVAIGRGNIVNLTYNNNDLVGVGTLNLRHMNNGQVDSTYAVGGANFYYDQWTGGTFSAQHSTAVGDDNYAISAHQTGYSATNTWYSTVAIGSANLGTWTWVNTESPNMRNVVGIGEGNVFLTKGQDLVGIGDDTITEGKSADIPTGLTDVVAIGNTSGSAIPDGSSQIVAIGYCAVCAPVSNGAANEVIALGDTSASGISGNHDVIAIGDNAIVGYLDNTTPTTGNDLIGIGNWALAANMSGSDNIAIGDYAGCIGCTYGNPGNGNKSGSNNVWIGNNAGPNTTTQLSNTIAIGYQAYNTVSNQTVIGNSSITSLKLFGCPSGQTVYDDGTGTCYTPSSGGGSISVNGTTVTSPNFANNTGAGEIDFSNPTGSTVNATLHNTTITLGSSTLTLGGTTTSVTGLTVDGVTPTTMGYVDATSSIQTQLNGKASSTASTTVNGQTCTLGSSCNGNYSTGTMTSGNFVSLTGTGNQFQDSGKSASSFAPALTACVDESTTFTPASGNCYFVSASVSTATPAASAFVVFNITTASTGSMALTGTTIKDGGNCGSYISGTTLTLPANESISVKSDGTTVRATCTASAGAAPTFETNGVNNSSQSALNLINSSANSAGLTMTMTNTSGGTVQGEIAGTANLSHGGTGATSASAATSNLLGNPASGNYVINCSSGAACGTTAAATSATTDTTNASNISSGTLGASRLPSGIFTCAEVWSGSGTSSALQSGDDAISNNTCYNDSGSTRTITAVKCRSDNASNTTTVNPTFGSAGTGTSILTGALTCGSSYAYSSSGTISNASWTTGSGIDPVMGGTLTGTSIAVIVEYHY